MVLLIFNDGDVEQLVGSPDCRSGPSGLGVRVPPAPQIIKIMSKFKICYDDRPDDIIDSINKALASHGLKAVEANEEDEDGVTEYEIIRTV